MARSNVTRLKEARTGPHAAGPVIDASFKVVRRHGFWRRLRRGVYAVLIAASIGFAISPLWVLIERLRDGS
jgi:hypothetical protein